MKELSPNLHARLQGIADSEKIAILSFVAPLMPQRISALRAASAEISPVEMYRLEECVKAIKDSAPGTTTLHLVLHTPGGELHHSYKIARYLRDKFQDIHAFVPYEAASGGTIICCAANRITLGELGNLTHIDPQFVYNGMYLSGYCFDRIVQRIEKLYGRSMRPQEIPTPWYQMAEKIDPIVWEEIHTLLHTVFCYADELLESTGYDKDRREAIAATLTQNQYCHSYCLMQKKAEELGFNIVPSKPELLETYAALVSDRLRDEGGVHSLDYFSPTPLPSSPHDGPHSTAPGYAVTQPSAEPARHQAALDLEHRAGDYQ